MEVRLYDKKLILEGNEKREVRESKLKTFNFNFKQNKEIMQTRAYTGSQTSATL